MVITLSGENAFALRQELDALIEAFTVEYGDLSVERHNGEEVDIAKLQEAFTSLAFFSERKMVVVREASKNKGFSDAFEQLIKEVPETTDIILLEPKLDKRLSLYKLLKSKTVFRYFKELDQNELVIWLTDTVKDRGGSLSGSDARYLVDRVGPNQQMLGNDLNKLLLYDSKISRKNIDLLTEQTPQSTIFQLLEAAFAGNRKRVSELYSEQRELKVEPPHIIAMLTWQLHTLAIIKTSGDKNPDQIAKEAKLNPYVVRKSQAAARKLSLNELKILISELLKIDIRSKRKNIDLNEALERYLLTLAI